MSLLIKPNVRLMSSCNWERSDELKFLHNGEALFKDISHKT